MTFSYSCSQSSYTASGLNSGTAYTISVIVSLDVHDDSGLSTLLSSASSFTKTTSMSAFCSIIIKKKKIIHLFSS